MIELKVFKGPAEYDAWLYENRNMDLFIYNVAVYGTDLLVTYKYE